MNMRVLISRKKIKSFIIRVVDNSTVSVSVPLDMDNKTIEKFLDIKRNWIEKKLKEKRNISEVNAEIFSYKKVLIQGKEYTVAYSDVPNVCLVDDYLILPQNKASSLESVKKIISNYLVQLAKNVLPKCIAFWGEKLSLCPTGIKIKSLKSKWGSCNGNGEIVLNVRLIQIPIRLMEYVVVHELCHLKNLNHSEAFWESLKKVFPDLSEIKKSLKEYEFLISI